MFIDRLKALIAERKTTWKDISDTLGIGKNQLKYWTDHDSTPDGMTLTKLAKYFEVSTDYLLGLDDMKSRLLDMLDKPLDFENPQIIALVKYFSDCDADGQFRIIHTALTEFERCEEEKKKEAQRAVAELKAT